MPHEDAGLRLDALDRGEQQDGAVEHPKHPLDLRDEVGCPGVSMTLTFM